MDFNRIQGLLDLYHKAGKSRDVVLTMASYWLDQKQITNTEYATVKNAIDAGAVEAPVDIKALITERDTLAKEKAALAAEVSILRESTGTITPVKEA